MEQRMKIALAEVNSILESSEDEITSRIPDRFKEYVKVNMDKEYTPNIVPGLAIFAQPVSLEAKELLRLVYRDFLANKEERDILIKKEKESIVKQENIEIEEKINVTPTNEISIKDDEKISNETIEEVNKEEVISKETNEENKNENEKQDEIKEYKELMLVEEKWYHRLFAWFKKLVNRVKI